MKGLLQWVPYVVVLGILYLLGRADFHIHHTILFIGVIVVLSAAMIASLFFFKDRRKSS